MVAVLLDGHTNWSATRDDDGHRDYTVVHRVRADSADGPATVMNCPGLPATGAAWLFDNDADDWAYCTPRMKVTPKLVEEPNTTWTVEQYFTSKPRIFDTCEQQQITDPLLMPPKISGSFVKYTKEAVRQRRTSDGELGPLIKSSSHETIRGPQVEFDHNRPQVVIEMNTAFLGLDQFAFMVDRVNQVAMWGLGPRRVKLSDVSWSRNLLGTCGFYYTRTFTFDIDFNTFDRDVADEGTKCIRGRWSSGDPPVFVADSGADVNNPQNFIRYVDANGNPSTCLLNGLGRPLTDSQDPYYHHIEFYEEANFFLLGIPSSF